MPKNHPYLRLSLSDITNSRLDCPQLHNIHFLDKKQLCSMELTYNKLTKAMKYAMYNHLQNDWSKQETIAYLKLICIKEDQIQESISFAKQKLLTNTDIETIINDMPIPPVWNSCVMLDQFIDTPMHLLFEGIVKSVIDLITQFMKFHKKWNKFAKITNQYLEHVHYMRLEYCKCEMFTNEDDYKPGGWLAETYLGFSRIIVILIIRMDDYVEKNALAFKHIKLLICSMSALLSRLMTNDPIPVETIDEYIKLFLGICHYFEGTIGYPTNNQGIKSSPFWYNKGNFVSLLNLPKQISIFGPVRLHWEGIRERFIQTVKPLLINSRSNGSFFTSKMKHRSLYVLLENKDVILAHKVIFENNRIFYKMNLPF